MLVVRRAFPDVAGEVLPDVPLLSASNFPLVCTVSIIAMHTTKSLKHLMLHTMHTDAHVIYITH